MTIRDHRPTNTQPPDGLSAENRALLEREEGACLFAQNFDQQGARFYPENINHLLNAARAEGPTPKPPVAGSEQEEGQDNVLLREVVNRLEDALRQIADGTYPPTRQETGNCPHGTARYHDCIDCVQDFARAAIEAKEKP